MAFSEQEVLMIVARMEASGAIAQTNALTGAISKAEMAGARTGASLVKVGRSMTLLGRSFMLGGAAVAGGLMLMTHWSNQFDLQMAQAWTQTDLTEKEFGKLETTILNMAKTSTRPLDELTQGLYDLFSTTNMGAPQAVKALDLLQKAATAGQADVRTTTRAAIGEMNAFGLKAQDLSMILDQQFQLVKLGGGTYQEFASALGMGVSSAVHATQTLESFHGMLELLTRSGMSASESVTSASRALDLLTRHGVRMNMSKVLGIDVVDKATGDFKQINVIMTEMAQKMDNLTAKGRQNILEQIFGQGEIRANRFFNIAIPGFEQLNSFVKQNADSLGSMMEAYNKMAGRPAEQFQILLHYAQAVAIELIHGLQPAINGVVKAFASFIKWLDHLSPGTKKLIVDFAALSAVFFVVSGVLLTLGGNLARIVGFFMQGWPMVKQWIFGIEKVGTSAAGAAVKVTALDMAFSAMQAIGIVAIIVGVVMALTRLHDVIWGSSKAINSWRDQLVTGTTNIGELKTQADEARDSMSRLSRGFDIMFGGGTVRTKSLSEAVKQYADIFDKMLQSNFGGALSATWTTWSGATGIINGTNTALTGVFTTLRDVTQASIEDKAAFVGLMSTLTNMQNGLKPVQGRILQIYAANNDLADGTKYLNSQIAAQQEQFKKYVSSVLSNKDALSQWGDVMSKAMMENRQGATYLAKLVNQYYQAGGVIKGVTKQEFLADIQTGNLGDAWNLLQGNVRLTSKQIGQATHLILSNKAAYKQWGGEIVRWASDTNHGSAAQRKLVGVLGNTINAIHKVSGGMSKVDAQYVRTAADAGHYQKALDRVNHTLAVDLIKKYGDQMAKSNNETIAAALANAKAALKAKDYSGAVDDLQRGIGLLPKTRSVKIDVTTAAAIAKVSTLQEAIDRLSGNVNIGVTHSGGTLSGHWSWDGYMTHANYMPYSTGTPRQIAPHQVRENQGVEVHIHAEKQTVDAVEIRRELEWLYATRGW